MLDTKKMHVLLKNNKTTSEVMEEFHISSEEEFECELRSTYTSSTSYGKIKRSLDRNDSLKRRKPKKEKEAEAVETSPTENVDEMEEVEPAENVEVAIPIEVPAENPETLEEVQKKIDDTISTISALERKHKSALSNRAQIRNRLELKKKKLQSLEEEVLQVMSEVEKLKTDYEGEEATMKEANEQIASSKELLIGLNQKREALETLYIWVYTDGIGINNETIEQIPDTWHCIYSQISAIEELDFLRVKEQKTLAKFIALKKVLPSNRKQELIFDSSEMEGAYSLIKEKFSL